MPSPKSAVPGYLGTRSPLFEDPEEARSDCCWLIWFWWWCDVTRPPSCCSRSFVTFTAPEPVASGSTENRPPFKFPASPAGPSGGYLRELTAVADPKVSWLAEDWSPVAENPREDVLNPPAPQLPSGPDPRYDEYGVAALYPQCVLLALRPNWDISAKEHPESVRERERGRETPFGDNILPELLADTNAGHVIAIVPVNYCPRATVLRLLSSIYAASVVELAWEGTVNGGIYGHPNDSEDDRNECRGGNGLPSASRSRQGLVQQKRGERTIPLQIRSRTELTKTERRRSKPTPIPRRPN